MKRVHRARNPFVDADAHQRYREGCMKVAWASLADGLVGVLSLGYLRCCWAQRASVDLIWHTLTDRRREEKKDDVSR
jgi:hypothetical protein